MYMQHATTQARSTDMNEYVSTTPALEALEETGVDER